jgi:RNA polymerase sigma-70 factor (ECF subfamily)
VLTGAQLSEAIARARGAWPGVDLPDAAFAAALAARLPHEGLVDVATLQLADLYLAEACVQRDPSACAAFSELVERAIAKPVGAIVGSAAGVEDIRQQVCQRLLVPIDGSPRIANYNGTVKLATWVRVIATRIAIDERRRRAKDRQLEDTLVESLEADAAHPELQELKVKYRDRFKAAITAAVTALSERDRSILRFTVEHGLTADEVGRIYNVHRVTVARWLRRIRDVLTERMVQELAVEPAELASMWRLLRSQVSLSVVRLLAGFDPT